MSQTELEQDLEQEYYCIMANSGTALEAAAHAAKKPVVLSHIAVGDGDGQVPQPTQRSTGLVHEVYRREIDGRRVDDEDKNINWISMLIPAEVGGFWIREFAVYAQPLEEGGDPVLYAIGNHAPYYKASKVLGQATTHQLEIPIVMSGAADVEINVRDEGYALQSELLATQSELLMLRAEFAALLKLFSTYHPLCELHLQLEPDLKDGFEVWDGGEIENGAELYPEAWEYLQSTDGQKRCISAEGRQELRDHVYYTAADGTEFTYGGIGGVPFYTLDPATGKIFMPDIRNMHLEMAGPIDSLNVGAVAIDVIRRIQGTLGAMSTDSLPAWSTGALYFAFPNHGWRNNTILSDTDGYDCQPSIDSGRVAPYGAVNRPRSLAVLACAYMGKPAS